MKCMTANRTLKRIGGTLRDESRDIVEAKLPDRLRKLLQRLSCKENRGELLNNQPRTKER